MAFEIRLLIPTVLYVTVIMGMVTSLKAYYTEEVTFTTRVMFYKTQKVIKGEQAKNFGLHSFIFYLIMFLTLLAYTIFGTQLGYVGIPICISNCIFMFLAFYSVRKVI